jgi:hypothetical protein
MAQPSPPEKLNLTFYKQCHIISEIVAHEAIVNPAPPGKKYLHFINNCHNFEIRLK